MPGLNDQHKDFIDREAKYFTGNPWGKIAQKEGEDQEDAVVEEPVGDDEEGSQKDANSDISEAEEIKVPPKELNEIDRVNYVVNAIENDCQIVPVGSFKMTS